MSTVSRFEDLICWQKARNLVLQIYLLTKNPCFRDFSLKDQIQRAAVSVMANISEGFERGTRNEFLYFLYIAKGSCGEVRSHLYVALDQKFVLKEEFLTATNYAKETSAILYKFIESLKVSRFNGLRNKPGTNDTTGERFARDLRNKYLKGTIWDDNQ